MADKVVRETVGAITGTLSNYGKIISHPFYKLGGDATLIERMKKADLPFGQGIDEDAIASGRKFMLGYSLHTNGCNAEFPDDVTK